MKPRIVITYGLHPNEYTKPYAEEAGKLLAYMGYEVMFEKVPFNKTAWGLAFSIGDALSVWHNFQSGFYVPASDYDLMFDFHTSGDDVLNPGMLLAEDMAFAKAYAGINNAIVYYSLDDCREYMKSLGFSGTIPNNVFFIEIPDVSKCASSGFLRLVESRCPGISEMAGYERRFESVADRPATLAKYPPEVLGKIIADGIEEQIIPSAGL